jgi:hypothetical protein
MTVLLTERTTSYIMTAEFDENIAVLMSDLVTLANSLIKSAEEKGPNKEELQQILKEKTKGVFPPLASRERFSEGYSRC